MIHPHSSTVSQRVHWVSALLAGEASYGVVSQMSRKYEVSRQTFYSWKAKGQQALQEALAPKQPQVEAGSQLHRAVLTLLVQGHASYRGIQACLKELLGLQVSLGTISAIVQTAGQRAQGWLVQQVPAEGRVVALDEQYSSKRGEAYQSAGRCPEWASVGDAAPGGGRWRKLDVGVMVSAGARSGLREQRQ